MLFFGNFFYKNESKLGFGDCVIVVNDFLVWGITSNL